MAPLPNVPGVARCSQTGTANGIPIANVFHVGYTGNGLTQGQADALSQNLAAEYLNGWAPNIPNNITMNDWTVTDLASPTGVVSVHSNPATGSGVGTAAPNNCAVLIRKTTARRYRGGHPKTFIIGAFDSEVVEGRSWAASRLSVAETMWGLFHTSAVAGAGAPWTNEVVVHYYQHKAPLEVPLVDVITNYTAEPLIASMRRRLT